MRTYLPATATTLGALLSSGELAAATPAGQLTGFAVTPGLRQWYGEDLAAGDDPPDEEDLEYAASAEAARASLRLLSADAGAARRRVVLAAEVADADVTVRDDLDRGVVRVVAPVSLTAVAAVFVDDAEAAPTVARAADAVDAADLGDAAAGEQVDDAEGFELSWYAPTELAGLVTELAGSDAASD